MHNRTAEDACPSLTGTPTRTRSGTQLGGLRVMGREVVVAVTNGRLDGFAELAEISGTWERILRQLNG